MSLFGNFINSKLKDASNEGDENYLQKIFNFLETRSGSTCKFPSSGKSQDVTVTSPQLRRYEHHLGTSESRGRTLEGEVGTAERKVSTSVKPKRFDLSPKNQNIVEYCQSLINVNFYGQLESDESNDLIPPTIVQDDAISLQEALLGIDELLRSVGEEFSGHEEEFCFYLQACSEARDPSKGKDRWFRRKFCLDGKRFAEVYKSRQSNVSEELNHSDYWATRQQLLSGKVVADWMDPEYGPLDPVFGVLLNPTLGRTGPGDSGWVHMLLFDDDGPMAYHSAVHDAFGYLITHHDIGPGYDYLGAWSLFESNSSMSGQLSGLKFWKDVLKQMTDIKKLQI